MKLRKIVIVLIVLTILSIYSAEVVIRTPERDEPTELIVDAMINILASCYGNEKFAIGVVKTFPEPFLTTLWSRNLVPILLFSDVTDVTHDGGLSTQRLKIFVIVARNVEQFRRAYENLENGRWFNRQASFLVVYWPPTAKDGCRRIRLAKLFEIAIYNRLFNLKILCLDSAKGRMLFTFNPHTDKAPAPWQLTVTGNESARFKKISFFEREYRRKDVCKNLDFDNIKDLGGIEIELLQPDQRLWSKSTDFLRQYRRTRAYEHRLRNIGRTFTRHLNGTMKIFIGEIGYVIPIDISDLPINLAIFGSAVGIVYPYMQNSISIATNFGGYKSQLTKVITVIDIYSRIGTCVTLLITLIFLKVINRQPFIAALLNVLRITTNTGFTSMRETNPSRFYRIGLYLFVVTMHGIFAGKLASVLTRDAPVEHPQTIKQLVDGNYTIYIHAWYLNLVNSLDKGRFVPALPYDKHCIDHVIDAGMSTACIAPTHEFLDRAEINNIYVSPAPIHNQYVTTLTGFHWPYLEKFNEILLIMTAADITDTLDMRMARYKLSFVEPDDEGPKVMTLNNLLFAFTNLGIGLGCATLCFIIEITNKSFRSAIVKARRRLSNCFRRIKRGKLNQEEFKVKKIQVRCVEC